MIIVTKRGVTQDQLDHIRERIESLGLRTHMSRGESRTVIGCLGDESLLEHVPLLSIAGVEAVHQVLKPYKLASREFSPEPTEVTLGDTAIGGNELVVIAGPCSVEPGDMLSSTARHIRGAFKPRSSPYSFQGMAEDGLKMLADVRSETGLPIVTEVMDTRQVDLVASYADVLQIGARNMQNFSLLTEVGRLRRPVLLKRGMSATLKDLLLAAEYVMSQGNSDVILCERGIRTFTTETAIRSTWPPFRSSSARRTSRSLPTRHTRVADATWSPRCPMRPSLPAPTA